MWKLEEEVVYNLYSLYNLYKSILFQPLYSKELSNYTLEIKTKYKY